MDTDNCPFRAEVVLRGFFEINANECKKEYLQNLYIINSSAILFPYLRSSLTDMTSKSDHEPITLPIFNFHTILEDLNIEDLIIDSGEYKEYK